MEMQNETTKVPALVQKIRTAANTDRLLSAVCLLWSKRIRARNQVTVTRLATSLEENGFHFTKDEIRSLLQKLADLGLGKLHKNTRGKVLSLVDIRYTLQSVGKAVVAKETNLAIFSVANKFRKLPEIETVTPAPKKEPVVTTDKYNISITGNINGRQIKVPLTNEEFSSFMTNLLIQK